ncbi:MAG: hypothetical protein ABJF50_05340, partial [Paracoccaceae bacterium]
QPIRSALSSFSSRIPPRVTMSERHSFSKTRLSVSKAVTGYMRRAVLLAENRSTGRLYRWPVKGNAIHCPAVAACSDERVPPTRMYVSSIARQAIMK